MINDLQIYVGVQIYQIHNVLHFVETKKLIERTHAVDAHLSTVFAALELFLLLQFLFDRLVFAAVAQSSAVHTLGIAV